MQRHWRDFPDKQPENMYHRGILANFYDVFSPPCERNYAADGLDGAASAGASEDAAPPPVTSVQTGSNRKSDIRKRK
jgi:hypothetical protein